MMAWLLLWRAPFENTSIDTSMVESLKVIGRAERGSTLHTHGLDVFRSTSLLEEFHQGLGW